jgi:hypothetical protein
MERKQAGPYEHTIHQAVLTTSYNGGIHNSDYVLLGAYS